MDNSRCNHSYNSVFKTEIENYIELKINLGHTFIGEPYMLKTLDDYLCLINHSEKVLSAPVIEGWQGSLQKHDNTIVRYTTTYRRFAIHLNALGYEAYIPINNRYKHDFKPHIFTENELERIFNASDNLTTKMPFINTPITFPVLVRVLFGCGLRISEALHLKLKDVRIDEGVLFIRNAKGKKDRIVPMHPSLCEICSLYIRAIHMNSSADDCFFPSRSTRDNIYVTQSWAHYNLKEVLEIAGVDLSKNDDNHRAVSLHNFRHTFAVKSLANQQAAGIDCYYSVPILSTYLGHENIYGTERYLQLTSEYYQSIIEKSSAYSECIFPEGLL